MIVTESLTINGKEFIKTYSDENRYVVQDETGIAYTEAIDPVFTGRTYTEGDVLPIDEYSELEQKAQAYDVITGVSE